MKNTGFKTLERKYKHALVKLKIAERKLVVQKTGSQKQDFGLLIADKLEKNYFKFLEPIITNITDAVLITQAEPLNYPGPRIIYVNEAFTKMTGYTLEDVIGKTPRILQGSNSDKQELKKLSDCLHDRQTCETTTINYKKNGNEFWMNLVVSPVIDGSGKLTHFIAIQRDVTSRKIEDIQKILFSEISVIFNDPVSLKEILTNVLKKLHNYFSFSIGEFWLINTDRMKIILVAEATEMNEMKAMIGQNLDKNSYNIGDGLPGMAWKYEQPQYWGQTDIDNFYKHGNNTKYNGLKNLSAIPLSYHNEIVGVLLLGFNRATELQTLFANLFENSGIHIGIEIRRKQLEEELNNLFNLAPDIICIVGMDMHFKKVNPAICNLLEYTEKELLVSTLIQFVHPDDTEKTVSAYENLDKRKKSDYFENRFISKSGKIKWLAWTFTYASEENLFFGVAKDITDKKDLEELLNKATTLARIGSWEIDIKINSLYWSQITKEIHEVTPGFIPDIKKALNFYMEGENRNTIEREMENAIKYGTPCDVELQIITGKGNKKWVRVISETEFVNGKCVTVYGSFQDITERKKTVLALETSERQVRSFARQQNNILEAERSRIAREIHDDFGQKLFGLKMAVASLKKYTVYDDDIEQLINLIVEDINNLLKSLRSIANELRPVILDQFGLFAAIEWLAQDFEKRTGIQCRIQINIKENSMKRKLGEMVEINIFRIFQEVITNVAKHANATKVDISISEKNNNIIFKIADNGGGIDTKTLYDPLSMGLLNIKERAHLINGELIINSSVQTGTAVEIILSIK